MEGRRRALPVQRAPQGSAREELGGASRDLRRAQEHRSHLHQGTATFRTTPGPTPGPNARAIEIGGPTHRHHRRRASFWSHFTMTDPFNDHTSNPPTPPT